VKYACPIIIHAENTLSLHAESTPCQHTENTACPHTETTTCPHIESIFASGKLNHVVPVFMATFPNFVYSNYHIILYETDKTKLSFHWVEFHILCHSQTLPLSREISGKRDIRNSNARSKVIKLIIKTVLDIEFPIGQF
jgi:hypothetical protein